MVISGRLDASDTDQSSDEVICSMPTEGVLSSEHLEVLSHEYKKSVPMYVQILKNMKRLRKELLILVLCPCFLVKYPGTQLDAVLVARKERCLLDL